MASENFYGIIHLSIFAAIQCERPDFDNGILIEDKVVYNVNDRVTFKCNQGFELQGAKQLRCENSGQWSGVFPTCERKHQNFLKIFRALLGTKCYSTFEKRVASVESEYF